MDGLSICIHGWCLVQEIFYSAIIELLKPRSTSIILLEKFMKAFAWITWRQIPDLQDSKTRVLLVNYAEGCSRLYQKVWPMSMTFKYPTTTGKPLDSTCGPLAIWLVENGHPQPIFLSIRIEKIYHSHNRLLYQIGRVEPLAHITKEKVEEFVWKSIIYWFGIPHAIVIDEW